MKKFDFCTKCPLRNHGMLIPKQQQAPKRVMVVAEAPNQADLRVGQYFSSPAGSMLRRTLRKYGFDLNDVYMTGCVKCMKLDYRTKWDTAAAIEPCNNILKREILHYRPKLIIGLGNFNLKQFLGSSGIVSKTGSFHKIQVEVDNTNADGVVTTDRHECLFMPLLTPEYIAMNMAKLTVFQRNLQYAQNTLKVTEQGMPKNEWAVLTDPVKAKAALQFIFSQPVYSFDLETTGLDQRSGKILGIGFSWEAHRGFYIPFHHRIDLAEQHTCSECSGAGKFETGGVTKAGKRETKPCPCCKGTGIETQPSDLLPYWDAKTEKDLLDSLRAGFANSNNVRIAHNMGFEHKWMLEHWGIDLEDNYKANPYSCVDTQVYAYFRDPFTKEKDKPIALGALVSQWPDLVTLKDIWDVVPKKGPHDLTLYHPAEKIGVYCCGDCDGTFRLWEQYQAELKDWKPQDFDQWEFYFRKLIKIMFFISEMHRNGIPVDQVKWSDAKTAIVDKETEIYQEMLDMVYHPYQGETDKVCKLPENFNPSSTPQMRQWCFNVLKCPKVRATKRNRRDKTSTDKKALAMWRDQYNIPFADVMLRYRAVHTHKTNLITTIEKTRSPITGCVHPDIKLWGTETGRLSVSKPALHGMPSSGKYAAVVRSMFSVPDGYRIVGADYSQIELRLITWYSQCKRLLEAYSAGKDMHSATAALMFDLDYSMLDKQEHPENAWMRRIGKTCNFGLCYGGSANVLVEQLGNHLIPDDVCRSQFHTEPEHKMSLRLSSDELLSFAGRYHRKFFLAYPELQHWKNREVALARERGYAISAYGRVRYVPQINSNDDLQRSHAENQAVNHPAQSTANDYLLFRYMDIVAACRAAGIETKPLLTIHDALYMMVPEMRAEEACSIVETVGVRKDEANITVPMILEPKIGTGFDAFVEAA